MSLEASLKLKLQETLYRDKRLLKRYLLGFPHSSSSVLPPKTIKSAETRVLTTALKARPINSPWDWVPDEVNCWHTAALPPSLPPHTAGTHRRWGKVLPNSSLVLTDSLLFRICLPSRISIFLNTCSFFTWRRAARKPVSNSLWGQRGREFDFS